MNKNYLLPLLAVIGVVIALVVVEDNSHSITKRPAMTPAPQSPYSSPSIAGTGIVEASTGNIAVGTPVPGIVKEIRVKVGDHVKAGDTLFKLDERDLQAQLLTARAKVKEAEASLQKPKHHLQYARQLKQQNPSAISEQALSDLRDDATLSMASHERAKAQLEQIKVELSRRTVRAPVDGQILQLHLRVGEYVDGGGSTTPMLLLGGDSRLSVRVDIDETQGWRFQPGTDAMAFVRSNSNLNIPLRFEYVEPYVIPKTAFNGQNTERTDVRVLQVIYSFDPTALAVYIGQQLDVFIQTAALTSDNIGIRN